MNKMNVKKNEKIALIMLGAPASGKGTQGEFLEEHYRAQRYVMSDMIKAEISDKNSSIAKKMKNGTLIDDSDIFAMFRDGFNYEDKVVIDGLPRTIDQAYWLYGLLSTSGYKIKVIYLEVDEDNLFKRVTSRYFCPKCSRMYN